MKPIPTSIQKDINACVQLLIDGHAQDPQRDYVNNLEAMQWVLMEHVKLSERTYYNDALYEVVIGDTDFNRNDDEFLLRNPCAALKCFAFLKMHDLFHPGWAQFLLNEPQVEEQKEEEPESAEFPAFVTITGIALRHTGGGHYYRDAGQWGVDSCWRENGEHVAQGAGNTAHITGKPLVPCTENAWRDDNGDYAPSRDKMDEAEERREAARKTDYDYPF